MLPAYVGLLFPMRRHPSINICLKEEQRLILLSSFFVISILSETQNCTLVIQPDRLRCCSLEGGSLNHQTKRSSCE